ncbi:MAG TPA: hypothetical protein EYP85_06425 [Armatimonadetes bacterium]|nr:hypothetical protein [Armatimonadota bacterium]
MHESYWLWFGLGGLLLAPSGLPAAEWSMEQETYSCYTSGMTLQELASGGVTVISHTPATREYCTEAHRWGLKVIPYVSLYKVVDSTKDPHLREHPFWREVDASRHPEWYLIREDGEIRRPFNNPNYPAPFQQSCCNHASLIEAYVRGVRNVMELGADGVFVDNVHPYPTCYGPQRGLHQHDWPEKDNTACYKMALRRVYQTVKEYGADKVVVLNSGGPRVEYIGYGDCLMWESYIWRFGFKEDQGPPVKARRYTTWEGVLKGYERWKEHVAHGVSIAPLTYLPDPDWEAENAFFAYGCARLSGFNQWTGTCSRRRDILRRLYRTRLGRPIGDLVQTQGLAYRTYERGLVVVNPGLEPHTADLPAPALDGPLAELFSGREVPVTEGRLRVTLPPESGRVYLSKADVLDNFLWEVEGQAVATRLRLEEMAEQRSRPDFALPVRTRLAQIEEQARRLRGEIRAGPAQDKATRVAAIGELTRAQPRLTDLAEAKEVETRLLTAPKELTVEQVTALTEQPGAEPPTCKASEEEIVLHSAGAAYRIRCEGPTLLQVGDVHFQLWVAPPPALKAARWLHGRRLMDVRHTVDEPDRQEVEARVVLYGRETNEEVTAVHVELAAEVRRGSPGLRFDCRVVNDGAPYEAYAFLTPGLGWQTDPTLGTVRAADAPAQREVPWVYLHRRENGGGGVLLTRLPTVGKSGSGSYIFGQPRTQRLETGGTFDLSLTLYPVWASPAEDAFLRERLDNLRRYAELAAQLVRGMYAEDESH